MGELLKDRAANSRAIRAPHFLFTRGKSLRPARSEWISDIDRIRSWGSIPLYPLWVYLAENGLLFSATQPRYVEGENISISINCVNATMLTNFSRGRDSKLFLEGKEENIW